ncbi:MAG: SusC/RagA family TonB-linked outer membrane protein [Bacteroidia bacterium]|nr:SusC/RagA family TonB-linked outer membrane protein [Bacteroidia bacterium]
MNKNFIEETSCFRNSIRIPRTVDFVSIFLFFTLFSVYSRNSYSQEQSLFINAKSSSVKELFQEIEKCSKYIFVLADNTKSELDKQLNIENSTKNLSEILIIVKKQTNLDFKVIDNQVIAYKEETGNKQNLSAQNSPQQAKKVIKGTVVDKKGEPVSGITVMVKGTTSGIVTNNEGKFQISGFSEADNVILECRCVGFEIKEVKAVFDQNMKIVMYEAVSEIEEVVVTGMFQRKVEGFTGAVTKITGEDIKKISSGNILGALSQLDPSFSIGSGNALGSNPSLLPDLSMRGQSNMGDHQPFNKRASLRGEIASRPNQPLFVLDGIIGVSVEKIIDLNPNQIESITLLKDAAASSIYGSRAANGVIVVETKAPKAGSLRFSYFGTYDIEYPDLSDYNLLSSAEKLKLEEIAGVYDDYYTGQWTSNTLKLHKARQLEINKGVNTYWLAKPLRTVLHHRHSLNIEGGDPVFRYKLNFDIGQTPGIMKGTKMSRNSAGIDLYYRSEKLMITNRLYVDYNINDRTSPYGNFDEYTKLNPYWRVYDENGILKQYLDYQYMYGSDTRVASYLNPMYDANFAQRDQNKQLAIRNSLSVEYSPAPNVRLTLGGDITKINENTEVFRSGLHSVFAREASIAKKGRFDLYTSDRILFSTYAMASYNKLFNKHLISLHARGDLNSQSTINNQHIQTGFPNDRLDQFFMGITSEKPSGSEQISRSAGISTTASYTYDKRYASDFSVRIDGSSEFGKNNRFAPFWAAGFRWNTHEEKFAKNLKFLDYLALRGSLGTQGSQGFTPYQAMRMFSYDEMLNYYLSSDVVGVKLRSLGNPDLKWQHTQQFNVGTDMTFLKNLISLRFDYYYKYTKNTVIDMTIQPSSGFDFYPDNMGNISNRGYEATLRIMPYNNVAKGINASIIFTAGRNINRIEKISEALKVKNQQALENAVFYPMPQYIEGYSQSILWGVQSLGIDPVSGKEIFRKRDSSMTSTWSILDQVPLGDTEPKLRGSIGLAMNYGNFSINISSRYQLGGYVYNETLIDKVENINVMNNADKRALSDRWQKPGDNAIFKRIIQTPGANGQERTMPSSRFVMKENLWELSNINLSYFMSEDQYPFLRKMNLSSITASVYLENILRFSTIQLERGLQYPFSRKVSFSLSLVF